MCNTKIKYPIFFVCIFLSVLGFSQKTDVHIGDVEVNFGGISCYTGDFVDESNNGVVIDGELCFLNQEENDVLLIGNHDYEGILNFKGTANSFLNSDENRFNSLNIDISNGDLFVSGVLRLSESLSLFQGRVMDDIQGVVVVENSSEASVIFDNSITNTSYLSLGLVRSVVPGREYYYPVGTTDSFHPIKLEDFTETDDVKVTFSDQLDDDWISTTGNINIVEFPSSGAWLFESNGIGNEFLPTASKISSNGELLLNEDLYAMYAADVPLFAEDPLLDKAMVDTEDFYLKASERVGSGMYALLTSDFGLIDGELELVNLLVIGQEASTFFIIPEIHLYSNIELHVYDSWGRKVFESKTYGNDFDSRNYPNGTYYYHLKATLKADGRVITKDDIIEITRTR